MKLCSLLLWFIFIKSSTVHIVGYQINHNKTARHFQSIVGYLRRFNIKTSDSQNLPPHYFFIPVVVLSSGNQKQDEHIQENLSKESYNDQDNTMPLITLENLVLNLPDLDNIDVNSTLSIAKSNLNKEDNERYELRSTNDSIQHFTISDTLNEETTIMTSMDMADSMQEPTEENKATTRLIDLYPNPEYNNSIVESLSVTTEANEGFRIATGGNTLETSGSLNEIGNNFELNDFTSLGNVISTFNDDHLEFNNEEMKYTLPTLNNKWQRFSLSNKEDVILISDFHPLAGLYYDGYLHNSLNRKTGFIPSTM